MGILDKLGLGGFNFGRGVGGGAMGGAGVGGMVPRSGGGNANDMGSGLGLSTMGGNGASPEPIGGLDDLLANPQFLMSMRMLSNGLTPSVGKPRAMFEGVAEAGAQGMEMQAFKQKQRDAATEKAETAQTKNRTVEWLRERDPEIASMVENKLIPAPQGVTMHLEKMKGQGDYSIEVINGVPTWINRKTRDIQKIEGFNKPGYRRLTPEEVQAEGLDAQKVWQVSPEGKYDVVGDSGVNLTVNNNGDPPDGTLRKELYTQTAKSWADYQRAGAVSASNKQDFEVLNELIKVAPQGPLVGKLAQVFPGASSAGAAFQSIVKRVAPTLRVPGSGATSDIEFEGMLQSLPSLLNKLEANVFINQMMTEKARINVERAHIISKYRRNKVSAADAEARISELDSRSIMSPELKQALQGIAPSAGADPEVDHLVEQYKSRPQ